MCVTQWDQFVEFVKQGDQQYENATDKRTPRGIFVDQYGTLELNQHLLG